MGGRGLYLKVSKRLAKQWLGIRNINYFYKILHISSGKDISLTADLINSKNFDYWLVISLKEYMDAHTLPF